MLFEAPYGVRKEEFCDLSQNSLSNGLKPDKLLTASGFTGVSHPYPPKEKICLKSPSTKVPIGYILLSMMTAIQRTVDIFPDRQVTLDVPANIPVGKTEIMIVFSSVPEPSASWRSLYGMCKNSGDTLEAFLERKHADKAFEDAIEERRLKERAKAKGETPQR
jgi:hypothetical protein